MEQNPLRKLKGQEKLEAKHYLKLMLFTGLLQNMGVVLEDPTLKGIANEEFKNAE